MRRSISGVLPVLFLLSWAACAQAQSEAPPLTDARKLVALLGRSGVFVDPSFGGEPLLVCGYDQEDGRAVLTLSRTGKSEPSLRGSLRTAGGEAFEVRSLHRAAGGGLPSLDPWGYEIRQGDERIAMIETVNRGRVWIAPETA